MQKSCAEPGTRLNLLVLGATSCCQVLIDFDLPQAVIPTIMQNMGAVTSVTVLARFVHSEPRRPSNIHFAEFVCALGIL